MDKILVLREKLKEFLVERDWEKFHNPKDISLSLSLEASELLEVFQWKTHMSASEVKVDEKLMQKIREELADVFIYALDLCNNLDINMFEIVDAKIKSNALKYPVSKVKGSAKKYTEYD